MNESLYGLEFKGYMKFLICYSIVTHICELCVSQMLRSADCHITCRRRRRATVGLLMSDGGLFSDFLLVLLNDSIIIIVGKNNVI